MNFLVKAIVAFCIGAGAIVGAQALYVGSIKRYLAGGAANAHLPEMRPVAGLFEASKIGSVIFTPTRIDTRAAAQMGATAAANRQITIMNNARNSVPVPRTFPGVPRY